MGVEVLRMDRDRASFDELALPLLDALFRYARWLTGNPAEAEDLLQETMLKAWRGFGSFVPGSNIRAWMFRILRNTFLTSRTGLRAVQPLSIDEQPDLADELIDPETPETRFAGRIQADALRRAIEALPVEFREVLLLCDVEEMRYREIAEMLSIPIGTVTSRLMRARRKLRNALAAEGTWINI